MKVRRMVISAILRIGRCIRNVIGIRIPIRVPVFQSALLKGRVALVTGGGSGIGYAIARAFLLSGAKVIITSRDAGRLSVALSKLKQETRSQDGEVEGLLLDLMDEDSFKEKICEINRIFGGIDVLVNNAGIVDGTNFDCVMKTNLKGPYFLSQTISEDWISNGVHGNILNICSTSSFRPGDSAYVFSKWGLRSMTLGLAKKLAKYGIVVNGLAPGPTATKHFVAKNDADVTYWKNPLGRLALPDEIGNLAVVLVSDMGRLIVGDVLIAGGGAGVVTFDDI